MNHIFISYCRSDGYYVSQIADALKERGLDIWMDVYGKDSGIPYSTKWFEVIEDALHTASGAIIFDTKAWQESSPCAKEFALIEMNSIPHINLDLAQINNCSDAVTAIINWWNETVNNEKNEIRTWLFSNAYTYKKHKQSLNLIPSKMSLYNSIKFIKKMKLIKESALSEKNYQKNPDIITAIEGYYKFVRNRIYTRQLLKMGGVVLLWCAIIVSSTGWQTYNKVQEDLDIIFKNSYYLGMIDFAKKVDPLRAMSLLSSTDVLSPSEELFYMQFKMVQLEAMNFPVNFYAAASPTAESYKRLDTKITNDRYNVSLSDSKGQLFLYDNKLDTTKQIPAASVPTGYCFSEDGQFLTYCTYNKAYAYNLMYGMLPVELDYNFEDIAKIGFHKNQIYAVTTKGNVVVWVNPIKSVENLQSNIAYGEIFNSDAGQTVAVYATEKNIVINYDNQEQLISLPANVGSFSGRIALSHDRRFVAASYELYGSTSYHIVTADIESGEIISDYDTKSVISGFSFSEDDQYVVAACLDSLGIVKIDLENGQTIFSNPCGEPGFTVTLYNDEYLVTNSSGFMCKYDQDLNKREDGFPIVKANMIIKQVAISPEYGYAFSSNKAGNSLYGCTRTNLKDNSVNSIIPAGSDGIVSNTSVAVSPDGKFVAFGYPNGNISVFDVNTLNLIWTSNSIPDTVVAISFSDDNERIYALGASGTIFTLETGGVNCVPKKEQIVDYWQIYVKRAESINRQMYDMGLSSIPPDSFSRIQLSNKTQK
jgi:WD40 repeat protein